MTRLAAGFLAVLVLAASSGRAADSARPVAAATIAPLADLCAMVAGPGWEIRTIVPPGTSPHVFEPAPRDVRRIAAARLVVSVGAGYDGWVERLADASAAHAVLHDMGRSIGVTGSEETGQDPHWWLSPVEAAKSLAPLAAAFGGVDPVHAAAYVERARVSAIELERLDRDIAAALAPLRGRPFLSSHAAWGWFAKRYGLRAAGSIEPFPGREPSPFELRALIQTARSERLGTLFTEPQFPRTAARVVAEEAGLALRMVDPIGGVEGRLGYVATMRWNAASFRRGLRASR